jgi:hypothetical protein
MTDFGGAQRRVDADEEDARPRAEPSGETLHRFISVRE